MNYVEKWWYQINIISFAKLEVGKKKDNNVEQNDYNDCQKWNIDHLKNFLFRRLWKNPLLKNRISYLHALDLDMAEKFISNLIRYKTGFIINFNFITAKFEST